MTDRFAALDAAFNAAARLGLEVETFDIDGEWHRCSVAGKKRKNQSGTYCLSEFRLLDGRVAILGMLNNYVTGLNESLTLKGVAGVSEEEAARARKMLQEAAEKSRQARKQLQEDTAKRAQSIWDKLPDSGRSAYLDRKKVLAHGVRFSRGSIVLPVRDVAGKLWSLQFIDGDGNKKFLSGGAKRGRFHLIKRRPPAGRATPSMVGFAEGYATASTIYQAFEKEHDIVVTFDAGNILPVSEALRAVYPDSVRFVFFADHDAHNGYPQAFITQSEATPQVRAQMARLASRRPDIEVEVVADDDPRLKDREKHHNTGVAKALLAAAAVDGDVVVPRFEIQPRSAGE